MQTAIKGAERIDWVDYAKGFCIVMVVMMHSTFGVELAAGQQSWMHAVSDFAKPFRMPDFFLISGLFLARVIDRDWASYLDRRVWHFVYFYVLWLTIQIGFKAPGLAGEVGALGVVQLYLHSFIDPFGTLWFIYLLPAFFIVTKLARRAPPLLILLAGIALESLRIKTGNTLVDEFASRFIYFYAGYWLCTHFFTLARMVQQYPKLAIAALLVWAPINGLMVVSGLAFLPGLSLLMGFVGAAAVIALAALFSKVRFLDILRYAGQHSITIYLAFFLPMAATRYALLKAGIIPDLGTVALIVTLFAIAGPLLLQLLVRNTPLSFLFERPAWLRFDRPRHPTLQPAE
ncbi:MAG TPA: acyltransferase family protein [Xanthobacteraceae bacterium]|jgi:uncharacterized membrane protein YcfT